MNAVLKCINSRAFIHKEFEFKHYCLMKASAISEKKLQIKFQSARQQLEFMLQVLGD